MKRLTLAGLLVLFGVSLASAHDVPGNPDRYTSFGLDYMQNEEYGVQSITPVVLPDGSIGGQYNFAGYKVRTLTADLRIPCLDILTVDVHGAPQLADVQGTRMQGFAVGVGVRFYLHD